MSAAQVDHLVVLATTLDEGIAWCEATLGVTPGPGGEHPLMGTHNRLVNIASPQHPQAYLEIIAINTGALPLRKKGLKRWFDMDDPSLQAQVAQSGPKLIHFVAQVANIAAASDALVPFGIDRGPVLSLSRRAASGLLEWQITVRDDGQRLFEGCLPTLIQWRTAHPTHAMPASGVTLQRVAVRHPEAVALRQAYAAIGVGVGAVAVEAAQTGEPCAGELGSATLSAQLHTPLGVITLRS